ncbi:TetR/AcrR family transcriptional regulator [Rhodococcus chondri]|uniref:TetR/AcrR family transcriptional regulator n=1 Tax=Rhodococcus chondri TaxID=3065941 RepID=A0ABU7JMC8_9NOCA|nr:TetR/AcrR family transcriptional regulator [Rhodococcus sp. CC-R104]MEE2031191.1 TetR/AcrR family transcriptional regulator [Rhodococcus sp. CC-R104]
MANHGDTERCDAARNRRRLLEAASLLVAERGVDAVTMEAVAARAGVGKGTVFRRFGSRAGLMQSLLDHTERELQQAFLTGSPPLGPGAHPVDRLVAFGRARIALIEVQGELVRATESSSETRFSVPPRLISLTHIESLLRAAGTPGDRSLLAQYLFAPLEASLVLHQWRVLGYSLDRLADTWADFARRVAGPSGPGPADRPRSVN